jgi:heptosyltransferase-3
VQKIEVSMLNDTVRFSEVRRVLIIKLRHHGDVLLSTPVATTLMAYAPHVKIDALVYAESAEILDDHPAINHVFTIKSRHQKQNFFTNLTEELLLFQQLRACRYDLVIHLTESWRGAWLTRILAPRWSVAPSLQHRGRLWHKCFTHHYATPRSKPRHTVESNLDALRRIGLQPTPAQRRVTIVPGIKAEARLTAILRDRGLESKRYIHIHAPSRWTFKCWTAKGWAAVIKSLSEEGWPVVLTAAPSQKEAKIVEDILEQSNGRGISLAGQLSLKELAVLSAQAKIFIGVDSAPMHIAAAVDTPVVALFGPSGEHHWGPWPNGLPSASPHRVVSSDRHQCRPCGIDGCGGGKISDCLVELSPDRVIETARALLC